MDRRTDPSTTNRHDMPMMTLSLFRVVVLGLLITMFVFAPFAQPRPVTQITIEAQADLGTVNRLVFGHNVEAADRAGIFTDHPSLDVTRTGTGVWNPDAAAPVPAAVAFSRDIGMTMLRYPGGCLAHNFRWQDAAGPVGDRPNFTFGLDEFLLYCREVGAEPLMMVSDYACTPDEAAALVEYLNAPADAEHPWARWRARGGHVAPYQVRYFEMGNESDHGNHQVTPFRQYTPVEYAQWVRACAAGMRAIDPAIAIGALMGTGTGPTDPWNATVLDGVKADIDFVVIHTYAVSLWGEERAAMYPADTLMQGCMAAGDQLAAMLDAYRALIRRQTGKDLPLAVTEYNAAFVQEKPVPYRFAYGPALFSAEYVRHLLDPRANVLMANYWQFANGYWGMVQGPVLPGDQHDWVKMPAYYLYRLWAQHFGATLVPVTVHDPPCVTLPMAVFEVRPAVGERYQPETIVADNLLDGIPLREPACAQATTHIGPDRQMQVVMDRYRGEQYLPFARVTAPRGSVYQVSCEARVTGEVANARLGIGIIDARGWFETKSGTAIDTLAHARDWTPFSCTFASLSACEGVELTWRLLAPTPVTGVLAVRNLKVSVIEPERFPAYAALTAAASRSQDGRTLYVILFNKHHVDDLPVALRLHGATVGTARKWMVTGPSLSSTNLHGEVVRETVSGDPIPLQEDGSLSDILPAHSMTAYELTILHATR